LNRNQDRAVAYIRISTAEQDLSPIAQREAILRWAGADVTIVAWHEDLGVSGGLPVERRPGLLAALNAIKSERAGVLVAAKRDRIGRDLVNVAMLERLVERAGARVETADRVGAGSSPEAALMRSLVDAFAQYERMVIKSRTRSALAVKRQRGERTGQIPFGFVLGSDGVRLEPNPAEQAVLATIAGLRAAGATLRQIVDQLNADGVPARGRRWHVTTIARILRSGRAGAAHDPALTEVNAPGPPIVGAAVDAADA
jgi:DNA invertase Pin-like site-specific DNA recombinase